MAYPAMREDVSMNVIPLKVSRLQVAYAGATVRGPGLLL